MDQRAAEEYHTLLLEKLSKRTSLIDRLLFIPMVATPSYFLFGGYLGAIFGGMLGWGICAILLGLDQSTIERWEVEYYRHLYEHTNEGEAGEATYKRKLALDSALKKWWHF